MKGKILIAGLLSLVMIYGCGGRAATRQTVQTPDNKECMQNFTSAGSRMSGRTFKTHQLVRNITKSVAIERAARYIATAGGWQINTIDKELGVISASQTVSFGNGKTVPLNVSVEPVEDGVNVSLSLSAAGGLAVRGETLKSTFCSIIEAIEK